MATEGRENQTDLGNVDFKNYDQRSQTQKSKIHKWKQLHVYCIYQIDWKSRDTNKQFQLDR